MLRRSQWLGLALTALFLWLAFSRVNLPQLAAQLQQANYGLVVPAALCTMLGYVLRTTRWRMILGEPAVIGFGRVFSILMIGFATNNVLPARLGEFVRAVLLRRRTGLRKTSSLATIFLERVFDGLVLVTILAVVSLYLALPGWGQDVQMFTSLVFLGAAGVVVLLLTKRALAERIFGLVLRPLPPRAAAWGTEAFDAFLLGLQTLRRPRVLALTFGASLAVWLAEGLSYYVLTYAFDFPLQGLERIAACALLLVVVNFGIMVPSAPGYVGTFQWFAVAALAVYRVPAEIALSLAIVAHAMQYVLVTAVGAIFVMQSQLSWRSLATARQTDDVDAAGALTTGGGA